MVVFYLILITISTLNPILSCSFEDSSTNFAYNVINVLCNKSQLFRNQIQKFIDKSLDTPTNIKIFIVQSVKAYTVVEPTPKEIERADQALSISFTLTSGLFPDSNDAMTTFCSERKERREIYRNYVIRKYTLNMICRLAFDLIATKLENQNDIYCDDQVERDVFLKYTNDIKNYESELVKIRYKFKKALIDIQHTNLGYSKTKAFCCSFWMFKNETLTAITNENTQRFYRNTFDEYFNLMTDYFCFYIINCDTYEPPIDVNDPQAEQFSVAFNMVKATAKVTSLLL